MRGLLGSQLTHVAVHRVLSQVAHYGKREIVHGIIARKQASREEKRHAKLGTVHIFTFFEPR